MQIRLKSKLANVLNGVDVTNEHVGDVIEVSQAQGFMLIAEGWAERISEEAQADVPRESDSQTQIR